MTIQLENYDNFTTALEEVEILIEVAKEFETQDEKKYSVFNKSALLLLAGKFENFAETVAEDYIAKINDLQLPPNMIPDKLLLQHTFKALEKIDGLKHPHKHSQAKTLFSKLGKVWGNTNNPVNLTIDCKFNYGRHGETEVKKLFKIIGIDDIFIEIKVLQTQESLIEDTAQREINIKESFNSVTALRNNILHQDASPTITVEDVETYKEHLKLFAENLISFLNEKLKQLSDSKQALSIQS